MHFYWHECSFPNGNWYFEPVITEFARAPIQACEVQAALGDEKKRVLAPRPALHTFNTLSALRVLDAANVSVDAAFQMGIMYDGEEAVEVRPRITICKKCRVPFF